MASKYGLPESSKQHCCNKAEFYLYLNGTELGVVNLNADAAASQCGPVVNQFVVKQEDARKIATSKWLYKNDGKVSLFLQGKSSGMHSEVPVIKVVNGLGKTLYLGEPGLGTGSGFGFFDKRKKLLGPFSPCEPVKSA